VVQDKKEKEAEGAVDRQQEQRHVGGHSGLDDESRDRHGRGGHLPLMEAILQDRRGLTKDRQ